METKIGLFIVGAFILGALVVGFSKSTTVESRLDLGVAQQRNVYSYDTTVYLKDKILEACTDESKVICKYSCAPEGLCIFIPNKIVDDYKF